MSSKVGTKDLAVFDYETCSLHLFTITEESVVDTDFIEALGISSDCAEWMTGDIDITKHKKIYTSENLEKE